MAATGTIPVIALLLAASGFPWVVRLLVRVRERSDGAPSLALVRWTAGANVIGAALLIVMGLRWMGAAAGGPGVVLAHLWRHDPWSAILFGALAGLFLHFVGGGSPLPVASLRAGRATSARAARGADPASVALFVFGELASIVLWFGAALPTLLHASSRLVALPLVALGYGLGRAAAGQDHPLTGAIDGLLLGLAYLFTGSLLAVEIAHFVVDLLAYVSAASSAEEAEMESDAGAPVLSSHDAGHRS